MLQSRLGITGSYIRLRLNSFVNSTALRTNTLATAGAGFYLVTAFDKWFNMDFESYFNSTKLNNADNASTDKFMLKNNFLRQKLSLRIRPVKWVNIKLSGEQFRWKTFSGLTATNFFDALIKLSPPKWKYSFELKGLNLLDNRKLVYNSITNITVAQNAYQLTPRYITATVLFDF